MSWVELHLTLAELVAAMQPPIGSGLRIDRAELDVPLEAVPARGPDGLTLLGRVPHSRWKAGFLPTVHQGRIVIEPLTDPELAL